MAAIVTAVLLAIVFLIPNFFSEETVEGWPDWMPKSQIVLGLDLQGGSYLLYELDLDEFQTKQLAGLAGQVRTALNEEPRIGYTGLSSRDQIEQNQVVQVRIREEFLGQLDDIRDRLEQLRNPLSNPLLGGAATQEYDLTITDDGLVRFTYSDAGMDVRTGTLAQQSIEVISSRINELGTTEPSIQRQGADRILVEVPGLDDPQRLKDLIGQTAEMTFHVVIGGPTTLENAEAERQPEEILFEDSDNPGLFYIVGEARVRGQDLTDANVSFNQQTGEVVVEFRLNTTGGRAFADVTQTYTGRQFAIVLDDLVISAPVINEPILGGSGQISGNFSVDEANDLAILLRAGALPVRLTILEERTIGPGLGEDSLRAGQIAALIGSIGIIAFMVVVYGFLGILANIAVILNVAILFSAMTLLGATLTLPGIAGIVLIVGTAVDANVLIYERIREEFRNGRSAIQAIDVGFTRALATILDANITTLIAAIVLFQFGSGPIKGFAVTLGIGILTTLFTAFLVTRLMVATWVRRRRPTTIAI